MTWRQYGDNVKRKMAENIKKEDLIEMSEFKFHTKIVGTTFAKGSQEAIPSLEKGENLIIIAEPDNPHDKNAVAVYQRPNFMRDPMKLGYIPKDTAAKIQQDVIKQNVICTVAEITGGIGDKNFYGCNVKITVTRYREKSIVEKKPTIEQRTTFNNENDDD